MVERSSTAFITGGASGIGRALVESLVSKGWHVFIADRSITAAQSLVDGLNGQCSSIVAHCAETDISSWESQLAAFREAIRVFRNRIDFVAPIAGVGERKWIPFPSESIAMEEDDFTRPDLTVLNIDLTGVLYTISLAIQQFRRQERHIATGSRGKIGVVASVCGFYCVPTLPIYTAAKHGVVGLVRSYGALLTNEGITINAVCPNCVRTGISTEVFYERMEKEGLLVPMEGLMLAFEDMLSGEGSGGIYECGPRGGFVKREGAEYLDGETERSMEIVRERGWPLHYPPVE